MASGAGGDFGVAARCFRLGVEDMPCKGAQQRFQARPHARSEKNAIHLPEPLAMNAVFRVRQETLDAEGQPVALHEAGSEPFTAVVPAPVQDRVRENSESPVYQKLYAYVSGENVEMPSVTSVAVAMTEGEVLGLTAQYEASRPQLRYAWVWPGGPASNPLMDSWLLPGSQPLVMQIVGLNAELKLPGVMAVRSARSRALVTLDAMVANVHLKRAPPDAPPVYSLQSWLCWLATIKGTGIPVRHYFGLRNNIMHGVAPALDGLSKQWDVPSSSYQSRYMLDTQRQRLAPLRHFRHQLEKAYSILSRD